MQNLNFPSTWLIWIKNLVLSGTSQILINGLLGKKLTLKRGVRQGDPISPYLFIISMDFISRWFQRLRDTGAITLPFPGMKSCLLYADDALFFLKPDLRHIQILKIAFTAFHQISGLEVNFQKSELLLSRGTQQLGQQLAASMGCNLGHFPFTYLGLPLSNKRINKTAFLPLVGKFNRRLTGWSAKFLSIAGRLTLLNSVLSALPTYYMACFRLPKGTINQIDKIRRHFLWHGVTQNQSKLNLVNWNLVCTPKKLGGLGVKDLHVFNQAMLIKWCWQWATNDPKLWKSIFQATSTMNQLIPVSDFFSQTLKEASAFFKISVQMQPHNGTRVQFWHHDWGRGVLKFRFEILYTYTLNENVTLAEMSQMTQTQQLFRSTLSQEAQEQLQMLQQVMETNPITLTSKPDNVIWKWDQNGKFSVKSAYWNIKN